MDENIHGVRLHCNRVILDGPAATTHSVIAVSWSWIQLLSWQPTRQNSSTLPPPVLHTFSHDSHQEDLLPPPGVPQQLPRKQHVLHNTRWEENKCNLIFIGSAIVVHPKHEIHFILASASFELSPVRLLGLKLYQNDVQITHQFTSTHIVRSNYTHPEDHTFPLPFNWSRY